MRESLSVEPKINFHISWVKGNKKTEHSEPINAEFILWITYNNSKFINYKNRYIVSFIKHLYKGFSCFDFGE